MKRKFSLSRFISQILRLPLAGPFFRFYAPRRRWNPASASPAHRRILIANLLPSLGDTICYMAMVEVLRDALPDADIVWLADSAMAGLIAQHPDVDRVLTVAIPPSRLNRIPTIKTYYRLFTIMRSVSGLQIDDRFDVAIVPRGGVDPSFSAHAVWMLNLPRSVGYSHMVEPTDGDHAFGDRLLTDIETRITTPHEAGRPIHLLELTGLVPGALARFTPEATSLRGLHSIANSIDYPALLHKAGIPANKPFIVLSPGAGVANRAWPGDSFHRLCERIVARTSFNIVITGTRAERELGESVAMGSEDRAFNCVGKFNLSELIALLSHATAFVGNDSGAGHIAGPLGVPVISLHTQARGSNPYHIRAPEHGRPLGRNITVMQPKNFLAPCRERCEDKLPHCIAQISVDEVWSELESILRGRQ